MGVKWLAAAVAALLWVPGAHADDSASVLTSTVIGLDTSFFDSFNRCDQPGQLEKHAALLDPKIEFYHDNGGVSWTRDEYLEKTRKNVCGHFHRKLVEGSVHVYPIKDFGAIEEGEHMFCDVGASTCSGIAKFVIVWHKLPAGWQATRVLSYGHRALP